MKNLLYFLSFLLFSGASLSAQVTTWYIDQQNGSNGNGGMSSTDAFQTIDKVFRGANAVVGAGDTVVLIGEFTNPSYDPNFTFNYGMSPCNPDDGDDIANPQLWHQENTVNIRNVNGTKDAYITIRPFDANTVLKGDGANIFRMVDCSYIRIEDLKIRGETPNISVREAMSVQFLYIDKKVVPEARWLTPLPADVSRYIDLCALPEDVETLTFPGNPGGSSAPDVARPSWTDTRGMFLTRVNHIDIIGNDIQDLPGGGLRVSDGEYVNIIGNEVAYNSGRSFSGTHGLVITKALSDIDAAADDDDDDDIYRIKIIDNTIHHNFNMVYSYDVNKTAVEPRLDEGKGISLQRNQEASWSSSSSRFLVANNVCYWNGFSGVHTNDGDNMTFVNNTCYNNSYTNSITYMSTYTDLFGEPFDPTMPSYDPYDHYDPSGGNIGISISDGKSHIVKNNISVIDGDLERFAVSTNKSGGIDDAGQPIVYEKNIIYVDDASQLINFSQDPDVVAVDNGTLVADPLFVDPGSFNFDLQATSPAIGYADPTCIEVPTDYFGYTRDAAPDAGAIEFQTVLPVDLAVFTASAFGKTSRLHWTTLSESGNDYFGVERSTDGRNWIEIGRVDGRGDYQGVAGYNFTDEAPAVGRNYYRLKQTDFSGTYAYSGVETVDFANLSPKVFPNPAGDWFTVTTDLEPASLRLLDALGRNVTANCKVTTTARGLRFEVANLDAGVYFLETGKEVLKVSVR